MQTTFQTIEHYVPHRRGLLLIDRLLSADEDTAACELTVRSGLFADGSGVPAWVGIEYMAQAIAAWAGARHVHHGAAPKPGFLLGSRRYTAHTGVFPLGQRLRVAVQCELLGDNGLGMFDCRIHDATTDLLLAEARVSVYEPPQGGDAGFAAMPRATN